MKKAVMLDGCIIKNRILQALFQPMVKNPVIRVSEDLRRESNLLSKFSHELKTPVHGIKGLSNHLFANWDSISDSSKQKFITDIARACMMLDSLIKNMLQLFDLDNSQIKCNFKQTDIVKLAKKVVNECIVFFAQNNQLTISLNSDRDEFFCEIDEFWIRQLLTNLVINSVKHSSANSIEVKLEFDSSEHKQKVKICVIDDGVGFKSEEIEDVFVPFTQGFSAAKSHKGLGLGLSICKEIVQCHKGEISASNNASHGATVEFVLPILSC